MTSPAIGYGETRLIKPIDEHTDDLGEHRQGDALHGDEVEQRGVGGGLRQQRRRSEARPVASTSSLAS